MAPKVLILSASIGAGHTQAAHAIRDHYLIANPMAQITINDFLAETGAVGTFIKNTYFKMLDIFPDAYEFLYHWSQSTTNSSNVKDLTARILKSHLLHLLAIQRPDLIIFTHPFPCCVAAYLRRTGLINVPMVAVLTDFSSHQLWIHREVDWYFVANKQVKRQLINSSIDDTIITVTGIPLSPAFRYKSIAVPPNSSDDLPTILVMGGGLGLGAIDKVVADFSRVSSSCHLIVVTGKNRDLKKKLHSYRNRLLPHKITIIGYTRKIHELMAKANLLITKPGAVTCSEALAMELPLLLYSPIPGQEEENAAYLVEQGAAIKILPGESLAATVDTLLSHSESLSKMKQNASRLGQPNAAEKIVQTILQQLTQHHGSTTIRWRDEGTPLCK